MLLGELSIQRAPQESNSEYCEAAQTRCGWGEDKETKSKEKTKKGEAASEENSEEGSNKEGGESEKEGEEEEEFSQVDLAISLMLLGSVSFVMGLFTIVNSEDTDMRFYAWSVISTTISIFVAVLMFSSINDFVHRHLLRDQSLMAHTIGDFVQMVMYYAMLQMGVLHFSGALLKRPFTQVDTLTIEEQKKKRELRTKCWAILFAHTTGFAAINLGGSAQHGEFFEAHPPTTFIVVPVMYVAQIAVQTVVLHIRSRVEEWALQELEKSQALRQYQVPPLGSMQQDEEAQLKAYAVEKWSDEVLEAENDIAGLQVSFLTVQALRFNITGVLPNNMGIEEEGFVHPFACSLWLFGISMIFVLLTIALVLGHDKLEQNSMPGLGQKILEKMLVVLMNASSMAFAWCQLYIVKWELIKWFPSLGSPNQLTALVFLALSVSTGAFSVIFVLDKISDSPITGDQADMVIESIINALGILVGFSWEQSFDGGVDVIAALTPNPVMAELGLAAVVAVVVIAPWRKYILQIVINYEEEREEEKKEEVVD
eukprot:gnl/TRDRNA2_/TRDRNA2_175316_c0_seq9.p1 gnl/TRDRNA2_/TRDRNA2_175316_c0~~gnl/TRDRNA2_/TRDRNA2_175316_c0_seq9.p1  ORF type:complete len:540 (+),score=124.49 gnl/TRDRNA2_/TRDRNA2_175316_c0_seq9:114-1733(+)